MQKFSEWHLSHPGMTTEWENIKRMSSGQPICHQFTDFDRWDTYSWSLQHQLDAHPDRRIHSNVYTFSGVCMARHFEAVKLEFEPSLLHR